MCAQAGLGYKDPKVNAAGLNQRDSKVHILGKAHKVNEGHAKD